MTHMTDQERAEFEHWYSSEGKQPEVLTKVGESTIYKDSYTGVAWAAWQADRRAQVVPQGWKLVPVEPTKEWVSALGERGLRIGTLDSSIRDMLAAAPQPPATHPTTQGLDALQLLAADHQGMRVDYSGLLGQVQREIKRSAPGHAEMIRQLQGHLQELGQRWYAGDTEVVDELLQLYCVEQQARADLAAQAKQGGAA